LGTSGTSSSASSSSSSTLASSSDFASAFERFSAGAQSVILQAQSVVDKTVATTSAHWSDTVHPLSSGNRALAGDADALINDMHGDILVADGDATASQTAVGTSSDGLTQDSGDSLGLTAAAQTAAQALQTYASTAANTNTPTSIRSTQVTAVA
jgi:hypothetical protein